MTKINHIHRQDTGISLYRTHTSSARYVCFKCRVCFHRPYCAGVFECGNCHAPTTYAGNAFRAPPKRDIREWDKLEVLIKDGMTFNYYGMNGKLPDTANDARRAISMRKKKKLYVRRNSKGKVVPVGWWERGAYEIEA